MKLRHVSGTGSLPVWKLRRWLPAFLAASAMGVGVAHLTPQPLAAQSPASTLPAVLVAGGPVWQPMPNKVTHQEVAPSPKLVEALKAEPAKVADTPKSVETPTPKSVETPTPKPTEAPKSVAKGDKTLSFNFDNKPWPDVLEWFSRESGLVWVGSIKPPDSFTIRTPPGAKYTIAQVVDLLNEQLLVKKFLLVRKDMSFTVVPVDEKDKIDGSMVSQVTLEELPSRGKTEIVKLILRLKSPLNAAESLPEIKAMLSPFGTVVPLATANAIVIQDQAGYIRNIVGVLKDVEDGDSKKSDSLTYICKYIRAYKAAEVLRNLLSDNTTKVADTSASAAMAAPAYPGSYPGMATPGYPQPGYDPRQYFQDRFRSGSSSSSTPTPSTSTGRFQTVQISVEERTNSVLITGPSDKISLAETILAKIDVGRPGEKPIDVHPSELRTYTVPPGTAEPTAKTLQEAYSKTNPSIRIVAIPNSSQIMVYATPEDQVEIVRQIPQNGPDGGGSITDVIALGFLSPQETAATLSKIFPSSNGGPVIEAQLSGPNPGIVIKGTIEQIRDVKSTIAAMEGGGGAMTGPYRVINLDQGSASVLAEELRKAMQTMGKNPVNINNLNTPAPSNETPKLTPTPRLKTPGDGTKSEASPSRGIRYASAQIVDPNKKDNRPPINITVVGNKLIISSEDPEALQLISNLARYYTYQDPNKPQERFEIIRLRYADAAEAVKVLTEVFNGPARATTGGQGGGGLGGQQGGGRGGRGQGGQGGQQGLLGMLFGGGADAAGAQVGAAKPDRVRLVAETGSNSLIVVKASPMDLAIMKMILKDAIEKGPEEDQESVQRTYTIYLKNTTAFEMANTVRNVYSNFMGSGASRGGNNAANQRFAAMFGQQQSSSGDSTSKPPALTIGTDERSNCLIVHCSKSVYDSIESLVEELDAKAESPRQVVKTIQLKGIDPNLMLEAINAMQGRSNTSNNSRTASNQRGNNLGGGFGGGLYGGSGFGGTGGGFGGPGGGMGMPGGGFGGIGGGRGLGGGIGGPGGGLGGPGGGGPGGGIGRPGGGGPGGGGGIGRPGGGGKGGRQASIDLPPGEGPRNFDDRGMDAPSAVRNTLYDPLIDPELPAKATTRRLDLEFISAQIIVPPEVAPMPRPVSENVFLQTLPAPATGSVTGDVIEDLGILIIRADTQKDLDLTLDLINAIAGLVQDKAEPTLEQIYLKNGDANEIATQLNQIFSRILVGAAGNVQPQSTRTTQASVLSAMGVPSSAQNVYFIALPRSNSILVAAPKGRIEDVKREIERLDHAPNAQLQPKAFKLKKASAAIVAQQLLSFWNQRYVGSSLQATLFRITYDIPSNTIFVQGSPADLQDVEDLLRVIDTGTPQSVNDVKIFKLRNALADELASTIISALTSNIVNPMQQASQSGVTNTVGLAGGIQQVLPNTGNLNNTTSGFGGSIGGNSFGSFSSRTSNTTGAGSVANVGSTGSGGGIATKSNSIRFFSLSDGQMYEAGVLDDVHVMSDARINALIVAAPKETMTLIEKMIESLDTVAAGRSYINVFTLQKADALLTANLIQQLFATSSTSSSTSRLGTNTNQFGSTALGTGGTGSSLSGLTSAGGLSSTTGSRPLLTLSGSVSDGATLIDLRITVDDRTNSLIVAGSQNDLDTIRSIIARLESADVPQRYNEVYKLRNAAAADVATSLTTFITNTLSVYSGSALLTAYQQLQRNIVIVAEPVSNTLLVSATPQYFAELKRLIEKIDSQPPQVVIQVLIAEVDLSNTEEFGVEMGLQTPVIFQRGLLTAAQTTTDTLSGATVSNAAFPGFNFNTTAPLPNSNIVSPGTVGFQGLSNLGVGRQSPTAGVGGFVFSASSNTFNLLIRALKVQGRVDILSRPQVQVADNQTGFVQVGQNYPTLTNSTLTATGAAQQGIEYVPIGVTMRVTPRVNPEGKILMRVEPQVASVTSTPVSLGQGILAPAFNVQTVQTTVLAADGETVVLGGLITRSDTRNENGIPWFKDLPYVGSAFRYRTQVIAKRELLVIMTPHIVRSDIDAARILAEESRRISWCLGDVDRVHGHGMDVIGPAAKGAMPVPVQPEYVPAPTFFGPPGADPQPNTLPPFQPGTQPQPIPLPAPKSTLGPIPSGANVNYARYTPPAMPNSGVINAGIPTLPSAPGSPIGVVPANLVHPNQPNYTMVPQAPTQPMSMTAEPPLSAPGTAPGTGTMPATVTMPANAAPMPVSPGPLPPADGLPSAASQPNPFQPVSIPATEGRTWTFGGR